MELTSLIFRVDTTQLLTAKQALDNLSSATNALNRQTEVTAEASGRSAKAVAAETRERIAAEKIKREEIKTADALRAAQAKEAIETERLAKAQAQSQRAQELANKAKEQASSASEKLAALFQKESDKLKFISEQYSRGQSTILAYAKSLGATKEQLEALGAILNKQRSLIGGDTFDKSLSGLTNMQMRYRDLTEAVDHYNRQTGLTTAQAAELARDKDRIIQKLKEEGAALDVVNAKLSAHEAKYIEQARLVNQQEQIVRANERALRDTANAIRNVEAAEERLFSTVAHLNSAVGQNAALNERAALALGSYERNLRLAGIAGEKAAMRLAKFKEAQQKVTEAEAAHRASFVARGIGVQMGDVAVSLASGQNPLIVAIQQGDQIRSLIQTAGVEGKQMNDIMKTAFVSIITSFKDVGTAMSSFLIGGLDAAGKKASQLGVGFFKLEKLTRAAADGLVYLNDKGVISNKRLEEMHFWAEGKLPMALRGVGVLATTAAAGIGLLAIALIKTAKANDELVVSLNTSGAALGLSSQEAANFANAAKDYGTSANAIKGFIADLAKEGFTTKDALGAVTASAQKYAQVTGTSLEEIAKLYGDLSKDPVDALTKLAKETGKVSSVTLQQVQDAQLLGNTYEAVSIAIRAADDALSAAANDTEGSLSSLARLFIDLKETASNAWDGMVQFANSDLVVGGLRAIHATIDTLNRSFGFTNRILSVSAATITDGYSLDRLKAIWGGFSEDAKKDQEAIAKNWSSVFNPSATVVGGEGAKEDARKSKLAKNFEYINKERTKYQTDEEKFIEAQLATVARRDALDKSKPDEAAQWEALNELANRAADKYLGVLGKAERKKERAEESAAKRANAAAEKRKREAEKQAREEEQERTKALRVVLKFFEQNISAEEDYYDKVSKVIDVSHKNGYINKEQYYKAQEEALAAHNAKLLDLNANQIASAELAMEKAKTGEEKVFVYEKLNGLFNERNKLQDNFTLSILKEANARDLANDAIEEGIKKGEELKNQWLAYQKLREEAALKFATPKERQMLDSQRKADDVWGKIQPNLTEGLIPAEEAGKTYLASMINPDIEQFLSPAQERNAALLENQQMYYEQLDLLRNNDFINEEKYQKAKAELDKQVQESRVTAASDFFGSLATIAGAAYLKQSKAYKAFAISQAIIDTYKGATSAYSSLAPIPITGPALGAVAAAAAIAAGMARVNAIRSQDFAGAYDKGGYIPAGKVGLVGEVGPELVSGPANVTGRVATAALMNRADTKEAKTINVDTKIYINATDAKSFKATQAQIEAEVGRRVSRAVERNS